MKGSVYIIRSHQTDDVYYGCTMQMLCKRMATHRANYKRWLNTTMNYITSFELLKYEDAYIELVEEVEYMNKATLYAREGRYIRENKCVNKVIPDRTPIEYRQDNKAKKAEKDKQHYEANKTEIAEQQKQHYEANKTELLEYQKQYAEAHKTKIAEYKKHYYEANKAEINERRREKRAESK